MWKYMSRRFRESFEKGCNHFEKRSSTSGIVNQSGNGPEENNKWSGPPCRWMSSRASSNVKESGNGTEEKSKWSGPPCHWMSSRKCWKSFKTDRNDTNQKRFNFECLNRSWLGAITWSGVLVIGWYTSQLTYLKLKHRSKKYQEQCKSFNNVIAAFYPYVNHVKKNPAQLNSSSNIEDIIHNLKPKVQLISNENQDINQPQSSSGNSSASSNDDFQDTLNYIENKLGWAAIQNGQLTDGIKLLRSAAYRNHAPALYNLGLCYEMGIGLDVNEKKAMELYRSAACLEHPDALYNLSVYYAQGRGGLTKDKVTATRLMRLAAVKGHQIAKETLDYLEVDVTETEKETELNTWSYRYSPFAQNGVGPPTLTSLFVENVNFLQPHKFTEAVV